jgi:hypothetical protein
MCLSMGITAKYHFSPGLPSGSPKTLDAHIFLKSSLFWKYEGKIFPKVYNTSQSDLIWHLLSKDLWSRVKFSIWFPPILLIITDAPPSSLCDPKWVQRVGFAKKVRNLVPLPASNTKRGRGVVLKAPGLD